MPDTKKRKKTTKGIKAALEVNSPRVETTLCDLDASKTAGLDGSTESVASLVDDDRML